MRLSFTLPVVAKDEEEEEEEEGGLGPCAVALSNGDVEDDGTLV